MKRFKVLAMTLIIVISSLPAGVPIKIMPVGDSITAGEHHGEPAVEERTGYRKDLYWMLTDAGYNVDFVGPEKHGERPRASEDWYDWNSYGYPGGQITQFCFWITPALEEYKPDIILSHLGTNGGAWQKQAGYNMYYLDRINDYAVANNHPITVFICQIINRYPGGVHAETSQLNKDIADSVATRTGDFIKVIVVDMEHGAGLDYTDAEPDPNANPPYAGGDMWGTTYPGIAEDLYHPNDRGNHKMAVKFYEELVNELGAPTGLNEGPIAYWPMDDGTGTMVKDVVGDNHGTLIGLDPAAAWLPEGGVDFTGIDSTHIEVPHADTLDFADESFTISMLIRYLTPPEEHNDDRWIIKGTHTNPPGTGSRYEVFHTGGPYVRFSIDDNRQKSKLEVPNAAFVTGDWAHVAAVRDVAKDSIMIYANGVLQGAAYNYSEDISNGEVLWIGESTDEEGTAMDGDMKEVRLYDYAMTPDQVADLFRSYGITNTTSLYTGVDNDDATPETCMLMQNYPNPFNPTTNIRFQTVEDGHVTISVYNSLGQQIETLIDRELNSGMHQVTFDARQQTSGLYFYRIEADGFSEMKKMLLLK